MQSPNLNRSSHGLPFCPACECKHYPATNGAGFKVWCDGSRVETDNEIEARSIQETADRARRAKARAKVEKEYAEEYALAFKARTEELERAQSRYKARELARLIIQAERASRAHTPVLELWEAANIPDSI